MALPLARHPQGKSLPTTRHMLVHVMVVSFLAMALPLARHPQGKSLPTTRHMLVYVMVVYFSYRPPPERGFPGQQQHQQHPQSGYPGQQAHSGYPEQSPMSVSTS